MRTAIFDIETTHNPHLLRLACDCAQQRAARRGDNSEVDDAEVRAEMALSPVFGRIVAVGVLDVDFEEPHVLVGEDERDLLDCFWAMAEGYDLYVSWNGLGFDLPWLYVRSLVQGVTPSTRISTARFRYPGESNHLDLFALLTDWRGNRTRYLRLDLGTVARALGVEPPEGDGANVPALFEQGDYDAIRRHLESDLRATLGIWRALGCPGVPQLALEEVPF